MIKDVAFFSERGIREKNQDAIYVSSEKKCGVFVLADGMGGHAEGEVASSAIVTGIKKWWESNDFLSENVGIEYITDQCNRLLLNINHEVYQYYNSQGLVGGSTVVRLIICNDRYSILSAGDSRIYHANNMGLQQLTVDDVWENLPEVAQTMNTEQIAADPRQGKLTEVLGSDKNLRVRRQDGSLIGKENFLLCSDGLYRYCMGTFLEEVLCKGYRFKSAKKMSEMIRENALMAGTDDNYSAIVCKIG